MGDRRAVLWPSTIAALYRPSSTRLPALGSTCHAGVYRLSKHVAGESDPLAGRTLPVTQPVWGRTEGRFLSAGSQTEQTTWLAGAEHALPLTWSPDSRSIAVLADGEIKAVDIATGAVRTIGRAPTDVGGDAAWNGDEHPARRTTAAPDVGRRWSCHRRLSHPILKFPSSTAPSFLPDRRRFVYSQESNNPAGRGLFSGRA